MWIINVHNGYTIDDLSLGGFCGSLDLPHCEAQKSASHSSNPTQPTKSTQDTRIANASLKDSKTQTKESQKIKIPPIDINEYPTLKTYFDKVASEGKQGKGKGFYNRDDKGITPYNLRNCAYLPEFAKPKIVYSEIVREPQFYLDNGEFKFGHFYAEATSFILSANCHSGLSQESEESPNDSKGNISASPRAIRKDFTLTSKYDNTCKQDKMRVSLEYLLGILHSKLATFAFKEFYAGGGLGESGYRYKKAFLEKLPIPRIDKKQEKEFVKLVKEIVQAKENGGATLVAHNERTKILESRLDSMVYKLYGLDNEEIAIIGGGGQHIV